MWNCRTLKIQRTFQNWSRFLELQNFFAIRKWGKMYNVLRNVVFYHTRKLLNVEKIKSGYDLKLLSNLKDKTLNLQGIKRL